MKRTTLIAAVCAVLIAATGFAAAAPGSAPVTVDTGADSADEANADEHEDRSENGAAAEGAADERNGQGPAVDLPDQVHDHVSEIHDRISSFLSGDLEGALGDAISAVTPDDDETDDADESEDVDESDETDDTHEDDASDDESQAGDDEQTDDEQIDDDEQNESADTDDRADA